MFKGFDVGKYLVAKVVKILPKTVVTGIYNKHHGYSLGEVRWYPPWRQYCYKLGNEWFSEACLRDIADFLKNQNDFHKATRKTVPAKERDKKCF